MWLEKKQQMPMFGYIGGKLVEAVGVEPFRFFWNL